MLRNSFYLVSKPLTNSIVECCETARQFGFARRLPRPSAEWGEPGSFAEHALRPNKRLGTQAGARAASEGQAR